MTTVVTTSLITKTDFHLKTLHNITTLNCDKVQHWVNGKISPLG